MTKRLLTLTPLLLAAAFVTEDARADDADTLFRRGKALVVEHRYSEACPILAESVRLEPGIGSSLWLGECYDKVGRLAAALAQFQAAAATAAARHDDREKVALRRATAVEARVPRIVIAVHEVPGLEIKRDGVVVPLRGLTSAQPVDAGLHTVSASADGYVSWSASVSVPDQPGAVTVNVPLLERVAAPADPTPAAPAPVTIITQAAPAHSTSTPALKYAAIGVGAIAVGALGGGAFLGFQAKATYDASNRGGHCVNNACDSVGRGLRDDAHSSATLSTITFIGAGGALAAGVIMFVLAPSTSITPALGRGEAGLSLAHAF